MEERKDQYYFKKYWHYRICDGVFNFFVRQFYFVIFMHYYKKRKEIK